jgi:peptide deformylase
VERAQKIRVAYRDLDFRLREMELDGWIARIFQHEADHLDGKVFIDRMTPESRERAAPLLEELRRGYAAKTA